MSAVDPVQVFREPGRLVIGPTQNGLSQAYPHGGTGLGAFENGQLVVSQEAVDILSEAAAKRVAQILGGSMISFEIDLVQYDTDALAKIWVVSGTTAREPVVTSSSGPSLATVGLQPSYAPSPILLAPLDPLLHPGLLIFYPSCRHGNKRIPHGLWDKRRERIIIDAMDDAGGTGHVFACDLLANLSLT